LREEGIVRLPPEFVAKVSNPREQNAFDLRPKRQQHRLDQLAILGADSFRILHDHLPVDVDMA
jgi:hypothetical protein